MISHVEAYMLTLELRASGSIVTFVLMIYDTHRSMQFPGVLAPTRRGSKPFSLKSLMYHGSILAERRSTRPPSLSARLSLQTCCEAASDDGSNQSMESMICDLGMSVSVVIVVE